MINLTKLVLACQNFEKQASMKDEILNSETLIEALDEFLESIKIAGVILTRNVKSSNTKEAILKYNNLQVELIASALEPIREQIMMLDAKIAEVIDADFE